MIWRQEAYRAVLQSGAVDTGAVYPPVGSGRMWRWRAWVTASGHVAAGRESDEQRAKRRVEDRFRSFLNAAKLMPAGGDA